MSQQRVYVAGVGITAFEKPRNRIDYHEMGLQAATKALVDAGLNYDVVEQAFVGYVYGDSTCGQKALYRLGMTQIPIVNVNNNCSTGSTAAFLAHQAVATGQAQCALALGFEKMAPGSLATVFKDRTPPTILSNDIVRDMSPNGYGPGAARTFGGGGKEYCETYGATRRHIAAIAAKNHRHSVVNPYSQFRNNMTTDEVLNDKVISDFLTRGMCCPTSDGGGAAILCSESFVKQHNLENQAIEIAAMTLTTDSPKLYEPRSLMEVTGMDMSRKAAREIYAKAGITADDVKVIELHDCFAANELLLYDALGLVPKGKAHELVDRNDNTFGGKFVINPSGGLESKGHPLGATGLGMIFYLVTQLRGWAGPMQAPGVAPKDSVGKTPYALLHNLGLGGACVMAALKRPDFWKEGGEDGRNRAGYNPGDTCREPTESDIEKARSKVAFSAYASKL